MGPIVTRATLTEAEALTSGLAVTRLPGGYFLATDPGDRASRAATVLWRRDGIRFTAVREWRDVAPAVAESEAAALVAALEAAPRP